MSVWINRAKHPVRSFIPLPSSSSPDFSTTTTRPEFLSKHPDSSGAYTTNTLMKPSTLQATIIEEPAFFAAMCTYKSLKIALSAVISFAGIAPFRRRPQFLLVPT